MGLGAEENLLCDALLCRLVLADMRTLDSRSFADEAGCTTRQALVRLDKLEAAGFLSSWRDGRGRRRFMYLDLPARRMLVLERARADEIWERDQRDQERRPHVTSKRPITLPKGRKKRSAGDPWR